MTFQFETEDSRIADGAWRVGLIQPRSQGQDMAANTNLTTLLKNQSNI